MRLCLVAAKPTDAVTYGLLPAAARLGLEVFLLTDQPDGFLMHPPPAFHYLP